MSWYRHLGVEIFVGQLLNTQFVKASNYKQLTVNQHNTIKKTNEQKEGNKDEFTQSKVHIVDRKTIITIHSDPGRELKKGGN